MGSSLYNLATFLHDIIHDSILVSNSFIKNSFHLTQHISDLTISDEVLLSLDVVVSLFTNVTIDLIMKGIERRWPLIERNTSIPKKEFFETLELVFNSTYFSFNNKFYKQTFNVPMGSPLSPIVADIVVQDLGMEASQNLPVAPYT